MSDELYQPTSSEILHMRPRDLRAWLTKRMAADSTLPEKIAGLVGFAPRWSAMSALQYAQVAIAWASLRAEYASNKFFMRDVLAKMTSIVDFATMDSNLPKDTSWKSG
jgi:hypothetical protein